MFGSPSFCTYLLLRRNSLLEHGYVLIDWIEDENCQILSNTFHLPHTKEQTKNLYRDLSKIMISLAKISLLRIGSWTINNNGQISLSNRPMLCHVNQLENWGIPSNISRGMTYMNADSYYLDLLAVHDNRLQYQGNAVWDELDTRAQAKDLVLMKAFLSNFSNKSFRHGPFIMQLTDLHNGNIFVDQKWNIRYIIDLEWVCSLPLGDLLPPFWLTGKGVDELIGPEYTRFKSSYDQFVSIFEQEEEANTPSYVVEEAHSPARAMKNALENGRYWYINALGTPKGLFNVFRRHIQNSFEKVPFETLIAGVSTFWTQKMSFFVGLKLEELNHYKKELRDIFNDDKKSGEPYYQ